MSALVDTNLFLDVLLERPGLADESQRVLDWFSAHPGKGWIAWHSLANLYYVGERAVGRVAALEAIDAILATFEVCPAGSRAARSARGLPLKDFEDALQVASAQLAGVKRIVTRNVRDFHHSPIPAVTPSAFLRQTA